MVRVYRLDWFCRISGWRVEWFDGKREAICRHEELITAPGTAVGEVFLHAVDIPTRTTSLVRWLNQNFKSNNV